MISYSIDIKCWDIDLNKGFNKFFDHKRFKYESEAKKFAEAQADIIDSHSVEVDRVIIVNKSNLKTIELDYFENEWDVTYTTKKQN